MINAQYFAYPEALMPVPKLTFHNYNEGYWKHWFILGDSSLDGIDSLLQTISAGSLVLFDDRFCDTKQYAIFNEYSSTNHTAEFQLLNDQLQPINAIAFLVWNADTSQYWCMQIKSACICLANRPYIHKLKFTDCKIQDGILGEYQKPVK